ncbi:MAG: CHAT domain-containing protein, partial [Planctomycetes bacterium]|nr:CHAT domain-containing protein [Planctomycetota bacterium]
VWDPVAARLGGAARVFVVPDGALHLVSFAALPAGAGEHLVERGPLLHGLSAERDLAGLPEGSGRGAAGTGGGGGTGLLVLGAPDFERDLQAPGGPEVALRGVPEGPGGFRSHRFGQLPQAAEEARAIARLWTSSRGPDAGPVALLLGPEATEEAFKVGAPGRRWLHLATHGFFLGEGGSLEAGAAGSRGIGRIVAARRPGPQPARSEPESALGLSGLALAGANRRAGAEDGRGDGVLTAEEIGALDLSGVEGAVLSACDTGAGEILAGEGVLGLRRAFQLAGVSSLVLSLWAVEDRSAREWMEAFYRSLLERGLGAAGAAREASLAVLRSRRARGLSAHPFYWAGFVAAGGLR